MKDLLAGIISVLVEKDQKQIKKCLVVNPAFTRAMNRNIQKFRKKENGAEGLKFIGKVLGKLPKGLANKGK
jgi:hypothetical protein